LLRELPAEQRHALELAYFGGMPQQDIADQFGPPLGTAKTRMRLGMEKLRTMWRRDA
jgi:RNA polymerase sigma-70 factor (ECF subfamily)